MGIDISAERDDPHIGQVVVVLTCDYPEPGIFCARSQRFTNSGGFISIHGDAMRAGWLERQAPQGRTWICPDCSGKAT